MGVTSIEYLKAQNCKNGQRPLGKSPNADQKCEEKSAKETEEELSMSLEKNRTVASVGPNAECVSIRGGNQLSNSTERLNNTKIDTW